VTRARQGQTIGPRSVTGTLKGVMHYQSYGALLPPAECMCVLRARCVCNKCMEMPLHVHSSPA
jgi:hypothetical protein